MFGKKLEDLTDEELKQLPMPTPSGGYRGMADRPGQITMAQAGIDTANKKYADLFERKL